MTIRVERGLATPEEVAAVTALLVAALSRPPADPVPPAPGASPWRRDEFRAPHSWAR